MTISTLPTNIAAGQAGHATIHNNTNTAINSLLNRVQDAVPGATAAAMFAGGTTTGAPSTGTFVTGNWVVAQNGHIWICTADGSPGTWADAGGVTLAGDLGNTAASPQVVSTHLSSALPLAQGGTAATSAAAALTSLGAAPVASPSLTGTPLSTTAAVDTNTTQIATTAFVLAQSASATPLALGTAAVGTTTRNARADHVHPTTGLRLRAPRVLTLTAVSNVYTPTVDTGDLFLISAPAAAFTVAAPTGGQSDGQEMKLRITSDTTGRAPTWNGVFVSSGVASLPTTALPASKTVSFKFEYDATAAKFVLLAADTSGY